MIIELDTSKLLVVFSKRYSLAEFRAASHVVPGTYADELVERMYNCLFKCPRDIQAEYERYYKVEYSDFGDFLYWKYGVQRNLARELKERVKEGIFIGYGRDKIGVFADETGASVLKHILSELGEKENENTD